MLDKIKLAIGFIKKKLTAEVNDLGRTDRGLKLDRGRCPERSTLRVDCVPVGKSWTMRFASVMPSALMDLSNRFITGLHGMIRNGKSIVDGQIFIDSKLIPGVVPDNGTTKTFKSKEDSDSYLNKVRKIMSTNFNVIENQLDIFIMPKLNGTRSFRFRGKDYWKFYFIRKDGHKSYKETRNTKIEEVFGTKPNADFAEKHVKGDDYLGTQVYHKSFSAKIMVVDPEWATNPSSFDGDGICLVPKGDPVIFHHDEWNFDVKWSSVLHLRSSITNGTVFKGTIVPVTYHKAKIRFKKKYRKLIIAAMEAGWIICTPDTFKDQKPGRYHHVELWWHNDSSQVSFWQDVKLTFSQYDMRRMFKSIGDIKYLIEINVKKLGDAMKDAVSLCKYILKNKEMYNDENTPVQGIVETLLQVVNGRKFGLHRSDEYHILKALRKIVKALIEVRVGTRNMKHWKLEKHNGFGIRAFVVGDPELKNGEQGIPLFAAHTIIKKLGKTNAWITKKDEKTYLIIPRFNTEARRHPHTQTSALPVKVVVRDDNFPYLTIPCKDGQGISDMEYYSADFDGDQMELLVYPTELFTIVDPRGIEKQSIPDNQATKKPMNVGKLMPTRNAIDKDIPEHHNAIFNLYCGELIGQLHYFIEVVAHRMAKAGYNRKEIARVVEELELGPLTLVIKEKKHNLKEGIHPAETARIQRLMTTPIGSGYRISNAKIDFTEQKARDKETGDIFRLPLRVFPKWLKLQLQNTFNTEMWPLHKIMFDAMMKYLPDKIEGTECRDEYLPLERIEQFADTLLCNWPELLEDRMGFSNLTGRLSHEILNKAFKFMMDKKGDERQTWIRRAIPKIMEMVMKPIENEEERAVAELMLMAFAYLNRATTTTNATKFPWIFANVSAPSFKKFIDIIYETDSEHTTMNEIIDDMELEYDEDLADELLD